VPLQSRREGLENYVLAQFGDDPSQGDFDDIRRSAGLRGEASIRSNDFLIAMALRLGYMQADECAKIKRIFAVLDRKGDGELSVEDIDALISAAATRNVKASGESEAAPGLPGARLDSDQSFDEFANPAMGEGEQADDAIVEST
jgi:Ca2+-binding EF-hand superfamily protein